MIAVIIPTGISSGGTIIRHKISTKPRMQLPANILSGNTLLWELPQIIRIIWGAINPIKPIIPPAQTAAAAPKEPAVKQRNLVLEIFTPRDCAEISPDDIISRGLIQRRHKINDRIAGNKINCNSVQPLPLKLPKVQTYILYNSLSLTSRIAEDIDVKKTLIALPAKRSRIGSAEVRLLPAIRYTRKILAIAPIKAVEGIHKENKEPIIAPSAAPEETPSIEDSAKELLKKPWKIAPDAAKSPPHKRAKSVRGSLISSKIIFVKFNIALLDEEKNTDWNTSLRGIFSLPNIKPAINIMGSNIKRVKATIIVRFFSVISNSTFI